MLEEIKVMLENKDRAPLFMPDYAAIIVKMAEAIDALSKPAAAPAPAPVSDK